MGNTLTNYQKGAAFERKVLNSYKANGCVVLRSAGSKSKIDGIAIDPKLKQIVLIQCKASHISENEKLRLEAELCRLLKLDSISRSNIYHVFVEVVSKR